jgi:HK97 family phage major capsid protein
LFGDGTFLLNQADFQIIQDGRPTSGDGHPLVDTSAGTILGKKFVLSNDVDRIVYGNWALGAYRSQSPMTLAVLRELYSEKRQVGFKAYQFADWKFAASTSAAKQPLVFGNLEAAGS